MATPNQKLRRGDPGVEGLDSANMKPGFKQVPAMDFGMDDKEDDDPIAVLHAHMDIVRGWFDGKPIGEQSWGMKFATSSFQMQNLIHAAITGLQTKKRNNIQAAFTEPALAGIVSLVLVKPSLFTNQDVGGMVPMFTALKLDASVLTRVIGLLLPDSVLDHLKLPGGRCDRKALDCPLSEVAPERLDRCRKKPKHGKTEDETSSNRAIILHSDIAIDKLLREDGELRTILRDALKQQAIDRCLEPLLVEKNFDRIAKETGKIMPVDHFKTLLQLCPDDVFSCAPPTGLTPLQMAVRLYESSLVAYDDVLAVIQALIERCPSSVFLGNGPGQGGLTPYRLLKSLRPSESAENAAARERAQELLKRACVGYRSTRYDDKEKEYVVDHMWSEKKEFLYWDSKSRRSYSCPPTSSISIHRPLHV